MNTFIHVYYQGFLELTKSCSHFLKVLLTTADFKSLLYKEVMVKIGYSVQGLVAKVNDTVANG